MLEMLPISLVICIICGLTAGAENTDIIIQLNRTITDTDRELYSNFINLPSLSTVTFKFENVNKNVSFIIFQAHSHLYNITMYSNKYVNGSYVIGTNVGMHSNVNPVDTFYIVNPNNMDLRILIAVHGYTIIDPIPGGCNMEFGVPIAPYLVAQLNYNKAFISVDSAPVAVANLSCDDTSSMLNDIVMLEFYRVYLPERDFSADTYFYYIKRMMNRDDILNTGVTIPETTIIDTRRVVSAYPGTGSIFVAVARWEQFEKSEVYSVYVPVASYGCSPLIEDDCELIGDLISKLICASLLFLGVFMCYLGHRFFKTEMFLFGMLTGAISTYVLMSHITKIDHEPLMGASLISGLLFGMIWLTFWWFYGTPVFAVFLGTLNLGFFSASVLYNEFPGGVTIIKKNLNFWTVFFLIVFLVAIILVSATYAGNILCCTVLGSYAAIVPIDYCLGSNLKYIIINSIRRATVPKFKYAVLAPPFELYDALLTLLWVMLAVTGFLFQHYHNRGKPPFPPPPRSVRRQPERINYGTGARSRNSRVSGANTVTSNPVISEATERSPLLA